MCTLHLGQLCIKYDLLLILASFHTSFTHEPVFAKVISDYDENELFNIILKT